MASSSTTPAPLRRSTRDRQPIERMSPHMSGFAHATTTTTTKDSIVPSKQSVASLKTNAESMSASLETPINNDNNKKRRRSSSKNAITPSSSSLSSDQQGTPLIAISKQVRVKIAPNSLLPKEFVDTSLIAALSKPLAASPISNNNTKKRRKKNDDDAIVKNPASALPVPANLPRTPSIGAANQEVRVSLTPSASISQDLVEAAKPLIGTLPATPMSTASSSTSSKKRKRRQKKKSDAPSSLSRQASSATPLSRQASAADQQDATTGMMLPPVPATPLTRQSSLPASMNSCFQSPFQTPSSKSPSCFETPNTSTGADQTPSSTPKQHVLSRSATRLYNHVCGSGSIEFRLTDACAELEIPKRRGYDIVAVLEGIGLMKKLKGPSWRLTTPSDVIKPDSILQKELDARNQLARLRQEECELDKWIQLLKDSMPGRLEGHVSSQDLAPLLGQDSVMLAIATPRDATVRDDGHHSFTLAPADDESQEAFLPRVFLLESAEEMRQLCLIPPPNLMTRCCSDFSVDALSHGVLSRQKSESSGSPWKDLCVAAGLPNSGSPSSHVSGTIAASNTFDTNMAAEALTELSIEPAQLLRHESFGLALDKTEPLPPLRGKTLPSPATTTSERETKSPTTDENTEPFQYPWMKGKPINPKYAPKRATGGLLCDSEDEPSPEHHSFMPKGHPWLSSSTGNDAAGKSESFLPTNAKRSLLWDCDDDDEPSPPHPAASLMNKISADLAPSMPTLLHECTSLVLCGND